MYQSIKKYPTFGFTLVELLLAIGIIGIISIIAVRSLYDIVSVRAKQQTIEDASDNFRSLSRLISKSIIEAKDVSVPGNNEVRIVDEDGCLTIKYDGKTTLLYSLVTASSCAPVEATTKITGEDLLISKFNFSPTGVNLRVISLEIEGFYKNPLGDHPFKYKTTLTPRI